MGHGLQHFIAHEVAQRVVNGFEVVQIDKKQCRADFLAGQLLQHFFGVVQQMLAVGQAGEQVVLGHENRLGLRLFAAADVTAHHNALHRPIGLGQVFAGDFQINAAAIAAQNHGLVGLFIQLARQPDDPHPVLGVD